MKEENHKLMTIVDLEQRLYDDNKGHYKQKIFENMTHYSDACRSHLDDGVPKEEFERLSKLKSACDEAKAVVDAFWRVNHEKAK